MEPLQRARVGPGGGACDSYSSLTPSAATPLLARARSLFHLPYSYVVCARPLFLPTVCSELLVVTFLLLLLLLRLLFFSRNALLLLHYSYSYTTHIPLTWGFSHLLAAPSPFRDMLQCGNVGSLRAATPPRQRRRGTPPTRSSSTSFPRSEAEDGGVV